MTETTQPDPQLVAWMHRYIHAHPHITRRPSAHRRPGPAGAWLTAHGHETLADSPHSLRELIDAYDAAPSYPLTVADIPAGQGAASLFIQAEPDGKRLWWKNSAGAGIEVLGEWQTASRVLWEHLAATLPTIEEEA